MQSPAHEYAQAAQALGRGDFPGALHRAKRVLNFAPQHPGAHYILGVAALELGDLSQALPALRIAWRLAPDRGEHGAYLARALAADGAAHEATTVADAVMRLQNLDPITLDTLGVVYTQVNAYAKALPLFRRAAAARPQEGNLRFNVATALAFDGEIDEAEREYEACLERSPRHWKAHLALAQIRRQSDSRNHISRLNRLLETAAGDVDAQMYLNLALAKELEDLRRYPEAFQHYGRGKKAGKLRRSYDFGHDRQLFEQIIAAFPGSISGENGFQTNEPIFVFGMPRSGTTLVERILSSHRDVQSAGELPNFAFVVKRASTSRSPHLLDGGVLDGCSRRDPLLLGESYLASTRPETGRKPRFVDKLPHNFLYAGLIARSLPNAKMICLRRDPLDTVLGNFRQLFAMKSPFYGYSFDVLDIARYVVLFDRLMAHWRRIMPGRILEVSYEALVDDQEAVTRQLLAHCGLEWDRECLEFQNNRAPVATASLVQVRQPLNRASLMRWKHYEAELAEARSVLAQAGLHV